MRTFFDPFWGMTLPTAMPAEDPLFVPVVRKARTPSVAASSVVRPAVRAAPPVAAEPVLSEPARLAALVQAKTGEPLCETPDRHWRGANDSVVPVLRRRAS
ncbi:MAG: hypothetical protein DI628_08385 [Blastochloris viridis]|uniref:Uncharacterized protein n=1 Tax=Blastochloris viridis TaxID=1079 RepID=A0A6N4R9Y7_BLAVI|nr:MAG: hypothetical protein DI628_08385 [Blastochloris viridis]